VCHTGVVSTIREVKYIDDLDGTEPATTISFGLDGKAYEIDLAEANTARLREALAPFLAAARKQPRAYSAPRSIATAPKAKPSVDREQNDAIREWARKREFTVKDRGRIPAAVLEAYHAEAG
jgi:predicted transcriptional regulator